MKSILIPLISLLLTVVFWPTLVWGDKRRDLLWVYACILISVLLNCVAFLVRRS